MAATLSPSLPAGVTASPAEPAPGFVLDVYEHEWTIQRPRDAVWAWLCDPSTFVDGQIWPYRVEFEADEQGPGGFRPGVFNTHSGPGINFAGVIGEIRPGEYRDLQYFYGSYAISHRLVRPTRLQFWAEDGPTEGSTVLRLQVDCHVRKRFVGPWSRVMSLFWPRFGKWAESQA